jgi:UDP-N-acetyl-alpha-D-muramoyl-L-alanyl-L-glutamate epimerase
MMKENNILYSNLQKKYPVFHFDHFDFHYSYSNLVIQYFFHSEEHYFSPQMKIKFGYYLKNQLSDDLLKGFIFNIGMIELISYWKSVCSPIIKIHPFQLDSEQESWWRKLYYKGLGEFFYQNGIRVSPSDFVQFQYDDLTPDYQMLHFPKVENLQQVIVPIGGGKDSVVTLEHYKKNHSIIPFIINPRGATLECARIAGFDSLDQIFIIDRQIDPHLLKMNEDGFLNGHTPFSAMLAFYTALVGYITNTRTIALSNESSANEVTIPGTDVNHQYSKSEEFEKDFQYYLKQYMNSCVDYFSYLRPYSELQIAEMFAQFTPYHSVFKSCNAGSKQNIWCCNCSKCLFAFTILSPFISHEKLVTIFGEDLFNKPELLHYFKELTGIADQKPFECVGTVDEVNEAIQMVMNQLDDKFLIQKYIEHLTRKK